MCERRLLALEVDNDTDPPVGSLSDEQGVSIRFNGWLGLASALDRLLYRPGQRPQPPTDPPDSSTTEVRS